MNRVLASFGENDYVRKAAEWGAQGGLTMSIDYPTMTHPLILSHLIMTHSLISPQPPPQEY